MTLWAIYGVLPRYQPTQTPTIVGKLLVGFLVGIMGVTVMLNPLPFSPGVVFDTRSILLSISGLFFGFVPTTLAVLMTSAFRLSEGGVGALTGVGVIFTSAGIGLAWRYLRDKQDQETSAWELYTLGILVHIVMLLMMLTLPREIAIRVLQSISLPVMLLYPGVTVILGVLFSNQLRRKKLADQLVISETRYRAVSDYLKAVLEKERAYISHEVNEEIGQLMAVMRMQVSWMVRHPDKTGKYPERLEELNQLIDNTLQLIRRLSTDLRPPLLDDLGLKYALDWFCKDYATQMEIDIELNLPSAELDLEPALKLDVFRMVQEMVSHIREYEKSTYLHVELLTEGDNLAVTVLGNEVTKMFEKIKVGDAELLELEHRVVQWHGQLIINGDLEERPKMVIHLPLSFREGMENTP